MNRSDFLLRARAILSRNRVEQELDDEITAHIELQARKHTAAGMARDEARRLARMEFGGIESFREDCRDIRGTQLFESFFQDLRYGFRLLRKSPYFTATAVVALALGIGANTALYHCFLNVFAPRLPFADPDRLVILWLKNQQKPNYAAVQISIPDLLDWRARSHSFSDMAATTWTENMNLGGDQAERIRAFEITSNMFRVLGIRPFLGRSFQPQEEKTGPPRVAILGYGLWQKRFAADPSILQKTITLDGQSYAVIGVMPRGFDAGILPNPDVLLPLKLDSPLALDRSSHAILGYGRLRNGVSVATANRELQSIARQLTAEYPEADAGWMPNIEKMAGSGTKDAKEKLPFFVGVAVLLLLLACANSASLALARYMARHSEIIVRSALGATRRRIVQQILAECLLLSLGAGIVGIAIALGGIHLIQVYDPFYAPFTLPSIPDARVLTFCAALIAGTTVLFGLTPAFVASHSAQSAHVNEANPRSASSNGRLRSLLIVAEIGIALALLIATGLMIRSIYRLYSVDLGFNPDHLLEGELVLKGPRYASASAQRDFFDRLVQRVEAHSGSAAAVTSYFPLSQSYGTGGYFFKVEGQPLETASMTGADAVTHNFFSLLGIRFLRGRSFDKHETRSAAIINQTLADRYWPNQNPLGKRVILLRAMQTELDGLSSGPREIIGVIKDVSEYGARMPKFPWIYVPFEQNPVPWVSVVIRAPDPIAASTWLRDDVHKLDPDIPLFRNHTAQELIRESLKQSNFQLLTIALFSAAALLLSSIGIFSVLAHSVHRRWREFGIRMALGATPEQIRNLVYANGLAVAACGFVLGLALSAVLGRAMSSLLFGVRPWDAESIALALLAVSAAIAVATYLPARRASRLDPTRAIYTE